LHPNQAILLDHVDESLFWAAVYHHPFPIFGASAVYLTPGSAARIGEASAQDFELPSGPTVHGLDHNQIVVYQVGDQRLKSITANYTNTTAQKLDPRPPRRIEIANPLWAYLLGSEWYIPEEGFRWMPRRATLRIGGPRTRSDRLYLTGFGPPNQLRLSVDGVPFFLKSADSSFHYSLSLPDQSFGRKQMEISIEATHTFRVKNDGRDLSVAFSLIEVR
jgi:hypothetical protein